MSEDVFTFTFVAAKQLTPADQRMCAVLKYARHRGLRAAKRNLRQEVVQECCAVLCPECAAGRAVGRDTMGVWFHGKTICQAHALREGLRQKERSATDAGQGSVAPLSDVRGGVGGGGDLAR
jgi:hypothetical protein